MEPLLSVRNLETWYGPVQAIRGVSLDVAAGRIVAVLGANGAGKTTLLNTIAGVIDARKGSIVFEGRALQGLDADEVARAGVVLVPEGRQMFPFLSVEQNLRMGAYGRRRDARLQADLEQVYTWFPRLHERRTQHAGLLSGGEQQMVAVGRAYMARPRLLLLDEPSLGLSPLLTKEIFAIVRRISRETGTAVLVVEQNAAIALATADDGYVVELGRIVAAGSCEQLAARADVKDAYLGAAAGPAGARRPRQRAQPQRDWL